MAPCGGRVASGAITRSPAQALRQVLRCARRAIFTQKAHGARLTCPRHATAMSRAYAVNLPCRQLERSFEKFASGANGDMCGA